ncbi:MAG: hypothetical protein IPN17_38490 [Deltaproteobacteria bacterium]|nr:hypothetical protein [Deltaproteobacteria bacterium]
MSGRPVSVLLVEDNVIEQEAVRAPFKRERHRNPIIPGGQKLARRGLALLRAAAKGRRGALPRPYLILLDLNMPRANGLEFLTRAPRRPGAA